MYGISGVFCRPNLYWVNLLAMIFVGDFEYWPVVNRQLLS